MKDVILSSAYMNYDTIDIKSNHVNYSIKTVNPLGEALK